ncbi:alpha/beta-hydrolase [Cucurbitaria berberidis CBS 394.84]|uniref:Carboxylic ester hydrolase n=1 Tax=Cucurbitaria berberidis CBS 394.84 TaxID=1168544 RepID=A0A9P4GPS2_9PLEO|nr:alpha/beta-hydrolase [Cucurbitaria berberidis CBS 394.84]KAF1849099.1 alpha/beta-hydrolase [Cucurbitaria berberidis CBS 394.84]
MGLPGAIQRSLTALAILTSLTSVGASLQVTLPGYGSFVGTTVTQTLTKQLLPATVNAWLGIDYASQPVGERRFAPVGPPASFSGVKNASQYGLACTQDPANIVYKLDEACLSMNVFSPQNISSTAKLPVLIWVHGGSFVSGSARSFDGAAFAANAKEPIVVVTFNYRINSLGFLPSPVFERQGLLNLGLLDQELLFKFVQRYISAFGGDPARVTIGGRSAGAHSVGIHLFHNYNKTDSPLFSQAILQSGSVTARAFPNASYPLYQAQFSRYLGLVGCSGVANSTDTAILSCLRGAPISAIQNAGALLYAESEYAITWPFQPTLGGPLLEQAGSTSGINGQFFNIPTITTNVRDEAKYFTPGDIETNDRFLTYLKNLIPGLSTKDLSELEALYPDPAGDVNGPYANSPNTTQYDRLSAALSDFMYICAGQETAIRMSSAGAPVYKLHFTVNNTLPAWKGIPHTTDTKYTWAEPGGKSGVQYPEVGKLLHGYFSDFVALGDPNAGNRTGVPKWPKYVDDNANGLPGLQLRMEAFGNSRVEGDAIRRKQCEWWRDEERAARLEK